MQAKVTKDTAIPALKKLIDSLNQAGPFYKTWAQSVVKQARKNARAHSKGGGFWESIARKTKIVSASDSGAEIACEHFAGAHKHFGGVIRAKNAKALTIPITAEARGKTAGEFEAGGRKLFVLPSKKSSGVLGYSAGKKFHALFVLRKSVTQKAEPWWPSSADVERLGSQEAAFWLKKQGVFK